MPQRLRNNPEVGYSPPSSGFQQRDIDFLVETGMSEQKTWNKSSLIFVANSFGVVASNRVLTDIPEVDIILNPKKHHKSEFSALS